LITPSYRKLMKKINDEEDAWHRQIREKMDAGMTFDEAWISCGGTFGPADAFGFVRPFRRIWPPNRTGGQNLHRPPGTLRSHKFSRQF